uniref:SURF1 family protein n=1 Tax=Thaumasiovibrio occultus TaxID=1891184 RepID=UPI00131D407E|nr:SURF1 family protein [Thaumasiovibrio occultus]
MRKVGFVLFTVGVLLLLVKLGLWQLSRAEEKTVLLADLTARQNTIFTALTALPDDARFYRVELRGTLDLNAPLLLDNQLYQGRVGYQLHYPLTTEQGEIILVNFGWLAAPLARAQLPTLPLISAQQTIDGLLSQPSANLVLADTPNEFHRIQRIDIEKINQQLGITLVPYVVQLSASHPDALRVIWQPSVMGPEKHIGYAVQWFAMALAICGIVLVALWRRQWRNH